MADIAMTVALAKALGGGGEVDPAVIEEAVNDWLDDHPEATTTVEDGAITKAKLDSNLQGTVDDVDELKSVITQLGRYERFEPSESGWNEFEFALIDGLTYTLTNNTVSWIDNINGRTNGVNTSYYVNQVSAGSSITFTATKNDKNLYLRINNASGTIDIIASGDISELQADVNKTASAMKSTQITAKQLGRVNRFTSPNSGSNWVEFEFEIVKGNTYTVRNLGAGNIDNIAGRTNATNHIYSSGMIASGSSFTFTANYNDTNLYMRFYGVGEIEVTSSGDLLFLYNQIVPIWSTWNAIGDSITSLNGYEPIVKRMLNISEYTNNGNSGWPLSYVTNDVIDGYSADFDLITFFMGTNDFGRNVPLATTQADAKRIFEKLVAKYPTKDIFVFLPLQRWGYTGDSTLPGGQAEPTMTNHAGITLRQYCDAIKAEAEAVSIPVCDLYYRSGIIGGDDGNVATYTNDGLHPNEAGYKLLSNAMIKFLVHYAH